MTRRFGGRARRLVRAEREQRVRIGAGRRLLAGLGRGINGPMPFVEIPSARLWYDQAGSGPPLVCLHGGWGRRVMPFDDAARVLAGRRRLIFPDRRGYGRSSAVSELSPAYHAEAAADLVAFLDALALGRAAFWGHSDGAVIAALLAALHPERTSAIVLEAIHFHRRKSKEFFARFAERPEDLGEAARERLVEDHGERWAAVVRMHSRAWLDFHERVEDDFYDGLLERIRCPVLVLHGARDPHTPLAEIEELRRRLRASELEVLEEGGHSPHSEPRTARACSLRVAAFLEGR